MSLTTEHVMAICKPVRSARRMRRYPEGNARFWAIIEAVFASWCVAAVAICVAMIFR